MGKNFIHNRRDFGEKTKYHEKALYDTIYITAVSTIICHGVIRRFLNAFKVEPYNEKNIKRNAIMCTLREVEKACLSKDYDFSNHIIDML